MPREEDLGKIMKTENFLYLSFVAIRLEIKIVEKSKETTSNFHKTAYLAL